MQESSTAPLKDKQCFNCGKALETHAAFCPHCGAPLPTDGSTFLIAFRIIGIIILSVLALLLGAAGACFMVVAASGGISADLWSGGLSAANAGFTGFLLIGFAALCIWGIFAIYKRSKKR